LPHIHFQKGDQLFLMKNLASGHVEMHLFSLCGNEVYSIGVSSYLSSIDIQRGVSRCVGAGQ